jgi:hypothetical protein
MICEHEELSCSSVCANHTCWDPPPDYYTDPDAPDDPTPDPEDASDLSTDPESDGEDAEGEG